MGLVHAGGKGSFHDHCLSAFFIWEEVKVHQAHRMAVYSVSTPVPGWWAGSSGHLGFAGVVLLVVGVSGVLDRRPHQNELTAVGLA